MDPQYRHTQVGWVMIGIVAAVAGLVVPRLVGAGLESGLGFFALVVAVILLVFSSLTVEVGRGQIRLWFGPGLVRKRIPLASVAGFQAVRNPWYSGWGIRVGPWGVLWNVSGFDAVELALTDGRRFRIGTDEPQELAAAIARARGEAGAVPLPVTGPGPVEPAKGIGWVRWPLAIVLGVVFVGGIFWTQMRPPSATVRRDGFEVRSFVYRADVPASEIVSLSLEPALPRVLARTNGFAAGSSLRGQFRLEGLGDGRLFLELGHPPYVLVRLREGFVIIGFRDPERTRALYEEMARAWPDRVDTDDPAERSPDRAVAAPAAG